jgi:hypothetical protein
MTRPAWLLAGALLLPPSGTAVVVTPGGAVLQPPGGSIVTSGGAVIMDGALLARPASSTTTPFSLVGQTVCSRGRVEDRPEAERVFWHDGQNAYGPKYAGTRCIRLP